MSQLPPTDPSAPNPVPVYVPGFEAAVSAFWAKNRQGVLMVCLVILLAIVGREAWQYFAASRERGVQEEYAKIADQGTKLAAFAEAHPGHPLAGVAWLRLADANFTAGDFKSAAANYGKAAGSLTHDLLVGRARIGAAMSLLQGGDQPAGEAALKAVSADAALAKGARAEAAYQLAALAMDAGQVSEAGRLAEEVAKIDATSSWAQRATLLLSSQQTPAAKPAEASDGGITFKPTGK